MTQQAKWGFLTNHALVLIFVVRHSGATVREISAGVGVTERATLAILRQLSEEGIVERHREGRRNTYSVNFEALAAYRREGTVSLTPREFVDGLIKTLLAISDHPIRRTASCRTPSTPARWSRRSARGASSRTTRFCCSRSPWTAPAPSARWRRPSASPSAPSSRS